MRGWIHGALIAVVMTTLAGAGEGPPIDDRATRAPALVEIVALDPTIRLDVRYATAENVAGRKLYPAAHAFLQRPAAEALVRVHRALEPEASADRLRRVSAVARDADALGRDPARAPRVRRGPRERLAPQPRLRRRRDVVRSHDRQGGRDAERVRRLLGSRPSHLHGRHARSACESRRLRAAMEREGFFVHPSGGGTSTTRTAEYPIRTWPSTPSARRRAGRRHTGLPITAHTRRRPHAPLRLRDALLADREDRLRLRSAELGPDPRRLLLLRERVLRAGARRHAPRRADPLRGRTVDGGRDPGRSTPWPGRRHRRRREGRGRPRLPAHRRRRAPLRAGARRDPGRRVRAPPDGLGRLLAEPRIRLRRRHARPHDGPALPVVRQGRRRVPRPLPTRRRDRRRHAEHRSLARRRTSRCTESSRRRT